MPWSKGGAIILDREEGKELSAHERKHGAVALGSRAYLSIGSNLQGRQLLTTSQAGLGCLFGMTMFPTPSQSLYGTASSLQRFLFATT